MKDDAVYLRHILDAMDRIQEYISSGREAFFSSTQLQDAVIRQFTVLGQATKNLSPGLRSAHEEIPWRDIAGFRDVLVHDYISLNLLMVWENAEKKLPNLKQQIRQILQGLPLPE